MEEDTHKHSGSSEGQRLVGTPVRSISTHTQCAHRTNILYIFIGNFRTIWPEIPRSAP